jgi:hypothetical protein
VALAAGRRRRRLQRLGDLDLDACCVPPADGFGDDLQEVLVQRQHEAAGLGALAGAADDAVEVGGQTDEVELLHRGPRP